MTAGAGRRAARRAAALALALLLGARVAGAATLTDDGGFVESALRAADARLAWMPEVAAAKWPRGLPVADPAREAAVVAAAGDRAVAFGLERAGVEQVLALQIRLAREEQERLYARWRAGETPPAPQRRLAEDLRPAIDQATRELVRALYLAAPACARADFTAFARPLAAAQLPATRWSEATRTEFLATLASVRRSDVSPVVRARAAGLLRFGTPADYAPFSRAEGATLEGADVALAERFAASLGLTPVFVRSSWQTLTDDLAADRFDVAIGGVSVTAARRAAGEFARPTARAGKTAIGRCRDRDRLGSLAQIDAAGVTVIENPGGTNETFARRTLAHARLVVHRDNLTVFEELVAGRADAMFTDETEVAREVHREPQLCRLIRDAYEPADKAFLTARGRGWRELLDAWLAGELAAGTPARLLEEYSAR